MGSHELVILCGESRELTIESTQILWSMPCNMKCIEDREFTWSKCVIDN